MIQGTLLERWRELCEAAAQETDFQEFVRLVQEINRILDEKEVELRKLLENPRD